MERRPVIQTVWSGIAALALAALACLAFFQHRTIFQLRAEQEKQRAVINDLERGRAERRSAPPLPDAETELERLRADNRDLLRLRNEVRQLRQQAAEVEVLRAANARYLQVMQEKGLSSNQTASVSAVRKRGAVLGIHFVPEGPGSLAARLDLMRGEAVVRVPVETRSWPE